MVELGRAGINHGIWEFDVFGGSFLLGGFCSVESE